jgi:hypothetical protein
MEQTAKKQWQKPELIVLVRSKPEEAVLAACKYWGDPSGAESQEFGCLVDLGVGCEACRDMSGS